MDSALGRMARQAVGPPAGPRGDAGAASPAHLRSPHADRGQAPADVPAAAPLADLTGKQQLKLWHAVSETPNFWETLSEHEPGAVRRLQRLSAELGWEVLFVTQRPATAGRPVQAQSQRWLAKHGFEWPSVFTTQGSRGRIADALTLDVHVDDRLEHAVAVATESRAWSILVWRDEASFVRTQTNAKRLHIAVVRTADEALDRIEEASRGARKPGRGRSGAGKAPEDSPAVVDRVKRALGFKDRE